jgi:hypothetical protein
MAVAVAVLIRVRMVLVIILTFWVALSCTNAFTARDLVGTWQGEGQQISAVIITFEEDGTFLFQYADSDGFSHSLSGNYEADFTKSPIPLSLRGIPQLPHPLHTVIQFTGPNSLRMGGFAQRWRIRPITFDPANTVVLERQ